MNKWVYRSKTVPGSFHTATEFINKYHPHWDVVAMEYVKGLGTVVIVYRVPVKKEKPRRFATVTWQIGDIENLRPNWSEEECASFLKTNESRIVDLLIPHGWDILEALICELEAKDAKA